MDGNICGRRIPALHEADEDESVAFFYDYITENTRWRDAMADSYRHPDSRQQPQEGPGTE